MKKEERMKKEKGRKKTVERVRERWQRKVKSEAI